MAATLRGAARAPLVLVSRAQKPALQAFPLFSVRAAFAFPSGTVARLQPLVGRRSVSSGAGAGSSGSLEPSSGSDDSFGAVPSVASPSGGRIVEAELSEEATSAYLSYAMSVVIGRALPDARDGLKPVHRRVLHAMSELSLWPSRPHRKCARVVGEVLGRYHPHGDAAVYDALVRLAQPFVQRHALIDGHGNFGSLDGDPAAAMRYTECRLAGYAKDALLRDGVDDPLCVEVAPTFDASGTEPVCLPARVPNLLVNGAAGIAVGIATKIPPHNLREVVEALDLVAQDVQSCKRSVGDSAGPALGTGPGTARPSPELDRALLAAVPAPDFPTGGVVRASPGLREAVLTGRGPIDVCARMVLEQASRTARRRRGGGAGSGQNGAASGGSSSLQLILTELPYGSNKASLVAQIASMLERDQLPGVAGVRDESDREGLRVAVALDATADPAAVAELLASKTAAGARFSANQVALVHGRPVTLGLRAALEAFLEARKRTVIRRSEARRQAAEARARVVEALLRAQGLAEELVRELRASKSSEDAKERVKTLLDVDQVQAEAVLALPLRRLTSLERTKLLAEADELAAAQRDLDELLRSDDRITELVVREAREVADAHGAPRRTTVALPGEGLLQASARPGHAATGGDATNSKAAAAVAVATDEDEDKRGPLDDGALVDAVASALAGADDLPTSELLGATTRRAVPTTGLLVASELGYVKRMANASLAVQRRAGRGTRISRLIKSNPTRFLCPVRSPDSPALAIMNSGMAYTLPQLADRRSRTLLGDPLERLVNVQRAGLLDPEDGPLAALVSVPRDEFARELLEHKHEVKEKALKKVHFREEAENTIKGNVKVAGEAADNENNDENDDDGDDDADGVSETSSGSARNVLRLLVVSRDGLAVRVRAAEVFSTRRWSRTIMLRGGDGVSTATFVRDRDDVVFFTDNGRALRLPASAIRATGRNTSGVRVMPDLSVVAAVAIPDGWGGEKDLATSSIDEASLSSDATSSIDEASLSSDATSSIDERDAASDAASSMDAEDGAPGPDGEAPTLVIVTEQGVIKRMSVDKLRRKRMRLGQGISAIPLNGDDKVVGAVLLPGQRPSTDGTAAVETSDEAAPYGYDVVLTTANSMAIRIPAKSIRSLSRLAGGVRGILLLDEDRVTGIALLPAKSNARKQA